MDIEEILKNMTVEEKLSLIVGGGGLPKRVVGAAGETRAIDRLNIPSIVLADGPAGVRISPFRIGSSDTYYATAFPNEIVLASTWNLSIVEEVGRAIGEEARDYGIDVMLSPALNIHRIPLGGRNFEYFSEDPLLSGKIASAYVKGVQSVGVGATLKHFVANDQETNRMIINVVVSERALREIYLRAFEIAIEESKPWAIMGSYNKLNGKYAVQNEWLLTKVLREEWGFDGLVMTDWGAGDNPIEQVKAGIDLIMPGNDEILKKLIEAYKSGLLDEKVINERAKKVLELVSKSLTYKGHKPSNKPDLEGHAKIAYEAAVEGFVLLKNENALPIPKETRVALFGLGSYITVKGGLGSGNVHSRYTISIADGLKERGVKIDEELERAYTSHPYFEIFRNYTILLKRIYEESSKSSIEPHRFLPPIIERSATLAYAYFGAKAEIEIEDSLIEKVAKEDDIAIITISRISGEGFDRMPVKGDFYLTDGETELIRKVSNAFHKQGKKVVAILNIPSPIEIVSWRDLVDAILVIWLPGQEVGRAVADVLLGVVSPSGKLPITWPKELYETPAMRTYPGVPQYIVYEEDIYVGYRYYDTFSVEPAYEFGYGLSYTKFDYSDLSVMKENDKIKVNLKVKNVGQREGKEVVQVYVRAPRGKLNKPFQELKGFYKTKLLRPNEEENVKIEIPIKYLASFNGFSWVVEGGEYEIRVGASSRDIRLIGKVEVEEICFDKKWNKISC